jgi:hypothetical protein
MNFALNAIKERSSNMRKREQPNNLFFNQLVIKLRDQAENQLCDNLSYQLHDNLKLYKICEQFRNTALNIIRTQSLNDIDNKLKRKV